MRERILMHSIWIREEERAGKLPESSIDMIPFLNRKEEKLFKKLSPDKKRKLMDETKKRYHSARAVRTMMDAKKGAEKLAGGAAGTVKKEAVKTAAQTASEAAVGTAAGAATGGVSAAVQAQKKSGGYVPQVAAGVFIGSQGTGRKNPNGSGE